jgi:hypothetical protein
MVDLAVLQTMSYLIAALSFAVTCAYYIMNLRNTQANMKHTLETRQAQLFMQIYGAYASKEIQEAYGELMIWEWKDLDDFASKYYHRKSLDVINKWMVFINGLGILVYEKLIDVRLVYNLAWVELLRFYIRFEMVIRELGERRKEPDEGKFVVYLFEECMRIYEERNGRKHTSPSGPIALTHTEKPRASNSNTQ